MKITPLRTVMLAGLAGAAMFVSTNRASAQSFSIHVGGPPPYHEDYPRWERPYSNAVWIAGHNEWVDGRWVWIGGYYAYPPHRHAHWRSAHYHHGDYYPGRWD